MAEQNAPSIEDLINVLNEEYSKPNTEFVSLLKLLFSQTRKSDGAFFELMKRADEFYDEICVVFQPIRDEMATRNHDTSNWYYHALLDCIASSTSPKRFTVLWQEIRHPHPHARHIAITSLGRIGKRDKEARKVLKNALSEEFATAKETYEFRTQVQKALKGE